MSDIFREVDEEVRQDRALAFWSRYQGLFLILAGLVVVATAGWRFYEARQQTAVEAVGARYTAAVEAARAGHATEAVSALDAIAKDAPRGYRQLAALRAADEAAAADPARALGAYDAIAADASVDPLFRDVARLRAAMLQLDAGRTNDAQARLMPLVAASSAFHGTARELLATAALANDDLDAAGRWLDEIVRDSTASQDMRQRAEAFLALVRAGRKPTG